MADIRKRRFSSEEADKNENSSEIKLSKLDWTLREGENPISKLNESLPAGSVNFTELSRQGPAHKPIFFISCSLLQPALDFLYHQVIGFYPMQHITPSQMTATGQGSSKQLAKTSSANSMLKLINQKFFQSNRDRNSDFTDVEPQDLDLYTFTNDTDENNSSSTAAAAGGGTAGAVVDIPSSGVVPNDNKVVEPSINSLIIMNNDYPNAIYEMINDVNITETKPFCCRLTVDGKVFFGYGKQKKSARQKAAENALKELRGLVFIRGQLVDNCDLVHNSLLEEINGVNPYDSFLYFDSRSAASHQSPMRIRTREFADAVRQIIYNRYQLLTSHPSAASILSGRKILAGIVMSLPWLPTDSPQITIQPFPDSNEKESLFEICVATGTRCGPRDSTQPTSSSSSSTLHDCHAEIIARRCFIQFLIDLMHKRESGDWFASRILQFTNCFNRRYRLAPKVSFHLYISCAPCGDARLFGLDDANRLVANAYAEVDDLALRSGRGQLRYKICEGEGTINIQQSSSSWDVDFISNKCVTMSCSDKLCLWNLIGFQGKFLSNLLEMPIYLSSIIVSSLFHAQHMKRALFTRVYNLKSLPTIQRQNYRLVCPQLLITSIEDERVAGKASGLVTHWIIGDESLKIGNFGEETRLSNKHLAQAGEALIQKMHGGLRIEYRTMTFNQQQQANNNVYQLVKEEFKKFCQENHLGKWINFQDNC